MDDALKKDIAKEYLTEYYVAEKGKEGRFLKAFHKFNRAMEKTFNKVMLDTPAVAVISTIALFAVAPHAAAIGALCFWAADAGIGFHSNAMCRGRAEEAIARDIDNGTLPGRYNEVLDSRIKGLNEQLEAYNAQKAQLPPKGTAAEAFAAAKAGNTAEPAPPAPAAQPEAPRP